MLTMTSGYHVKERRGRIWVVLAWCLPQLTSSCSSKCWNVLSEPTGKKGDEFGNKFSIPITSGAAVTGVITVDGTFYTRDYGHPVPPDTIDFTVLDSKKGKNRDWLVKPLQIEMGFSITEGRSYALLKCARKSSGSQHEEGQTDFIYNSHENVDTMFSGNEINIQVSDLEVSTRNSYLLYLGKPGRSGKFEYNYNSRDLWESDDYSSNRLNATNEISNSDNSGFYVYNSIAVCKDPQPVPCDDKSDVTIEASLGRTYTLSCSAAGAPYLGSRWERNGIIVENHQENIEIADNGADNVIESTLQIPAFTTDHIGVYTCIVFNKNFENSVEKRFTLGYSREFSLLQFPCSDTFTNEDNSPQFTWIVEGWPLDNIDLSCLSDSDLKINKDILNEYFPPRLRVELQFDVKVVADVIRCSLRNGTKVLDRRSITRVGYNCTDEQFAVGKECFTKCSSKQDMPVWLSHTLAFIGGTIVTILAALCIKFYPSILKTMKKNRHFYHDVPTSTEANFVSYEVAVTNLDAARPGSEKAAVPDLHQMYEFSTAPDNSASLQSLEAKVDNGNNYDRTLAQEKRIIQEPRKSATEKDSGVRQRKGKEKPVSERKFSSAPSRMKSDDNEKYSD